MGWHDKARDARHGKARIYTYNVRRLRRKCRYVWHGKGKWTVKNYQRYRLKRGWYITKYGVFTAPVAN